MGRKTASKTSALARNTAHWAAAPTPTASRSAAIAAPTANGARKNETVAISPTASSTAAMTHRTHASICGNGTSHPTVCTVGRSAGPSPAQQRAREVAGVEGPQVVELLSDADELHRDPELARDRERDAALRGAVELREDDPVHRDDL